MDCKRRSAHEFKTRLGFKQYEVIFTVLTKIMSSFEGQNMKTYVLSYRIELYFQDYKLAIEIDQNGHNIRNIDFKIKKQIAIEQGLGSKFIRIYPDKEKSDIFRAINEIFRQINNRLKITITSKISTRSLELEFKSDNILKSKAIKIIGEKNIA